MTTPKGQRERAGYLYLMASDAFGRGEPKFAELLIALANRYADQAAGFHRPDDQYQQLSQRSAGSLLEAAITAE